MEPLCPPRSLHVLVVDDCADMVASLALLLRAWGHLPQGARDGPEALRLAAGCPPDVVLLDVAMPGMTGWELARRLRQLPGLGPAVLVAVSGYAQEHDRLRSLEAGCDLHLSKPLDLERLRLLLGAPEKENSRDP